MTLIMSLILTRFVCFTYRYHSQQKLPVRYAVLWLSFPQQTNLQHTAWLWQISCWTTLLGYRAQWHSSQVWVDLSGILLYSRHVGIEDHQQYSDRLELHDLGLILDRGRDFCFYHSIQTNLGPIQPPIQWFTIGHGARMVRCPLLCILSCSAKLVTRNSSMVVKWLEPEAIPPLPHMSTDCVMLEP